MDGTIRFATMLDLSKLAVINSFGTEEGRHLAEEELPRFIEAHAVVVYEVNEDMKALLYFERKFFGEGQWLLTQITVNENSRRQGIGEFLWKWFLDYAHKNRVARVFADIRESNVPSTLLARKLGGIDAGFIDLNDGDVRRFFRFDLQN